MNNNTKLELTWIGKDQRPKLEPRILLEDPEKSCHAQARVTDNDLYENRLIHGDNLLALKALEQEFAAKIKCIYIDPPFNTGQAFAQYDDGVEHSIWLSLMRDRLELLRRLLRPDGSIWVHCDDNEQAYLRVAMDEVFGRENFITTIIWQKVDSPNDNKVPITPDHDYILSYSREPARPRFKQMPDPSLMNAYRGPDAEGRMYRDRLLKKNGKNSLRTDRPSMFFPVPAPDGTDVYPIHDDGREACWAMGKESVFRLLSEGKVIWKRRERNSVEIWVPYTREYAPQSPARPYPSIWTDVNTSRQSKAHLTSMFPGATPFETPKPEELIKRIFDLSTDEGDWVLDSFAGSGTTGAVAQKLGRCWIMVELGEHCDTHIVPRLKKVIDGEDPGGITESSDWKGGGGFRYYRLAPSLLEKDRWNNWIISKQYNAAMLAEAMCKLEGFDFAPSQDRYWEHGHSTERDFIYVTTQRLTQRQLHAISEEVGPDRSLLICCSAFRCAPDQWPNLTLKKIPNAVKERCEWGRDDYSLAISSLPPADPGDTDGDPSPSPTSKKGARAKKPRTTGQADLFTEGEPA